MVDAKIPQERRDFYVYILLREDGSPFYVGKGSGRRHLAHMKPSQMDKTAKSHIIRRMMSDGHQVGVTMAGENLTEAQAFELEVMTIAKIGRHPNGPLRNLSDGGEGPAGRIVRSAERAMRREQMAARMADASERAKIAAFHTGRARSAETCARIGDAHRGTTHTAEAKAKMSAAHKALMADPARRAVSAAAARAQAAAMTPEERRAAGAARGRERMAKLTTDERSELSRKALTARWEKYRSRKAIAAVEGGDGNSSG